MIKVYSADFQCKDFAYETPEDLRIDKVAQVAFTGGMLSYTFITFNRKNIIGGGGRRRKTKNNINISSRYKKSGAYTIRNWTSMS
jgi:hypothetical protein